MAASHISPGVRKSPRGADISVMLSATADKCTAFDKLAIQAFVRLTHSRTLLRTENCGEHCGCRNGAGRHDIVAHRAGNDCKEKPPSSTAQRPWRQHSLRFKAGAKLPICPRRRGAIATAAGHTAALTTQSVGGPAGIHPGHSVAAQPRSEAQTS